MCLSPAKIYWLTVTLMGAGVCSAEAATYRMGFSKNSTRMTWTPTLPSWTYTVPVTFSMPGDSSSVLRITGSANLSWTLDQRGGRNNWTDNAVVRSSVSYPILGPKATIGVSTNMSSRRVALQKQKIRSQSVNFRFQYNPFLQGPFRSMRIGVTPGLITANRVSRAKLDSTIQEKGIRYNATLSVSPDLKVVGKKLNSSFNLSKSDNTLKNNKDRSENLSVTLGYSWLQDLRTSFSFSENRTQRGVTRGVVSMRDIGGETVRDTNVVAEISATRSTGVRSSTSFKLAGFDVSTSGGYSENLTTNTANEDESERNPFFARDRRSTSWNFDSQASGRLVEGLIGTGQVRFSSRDERRLGVRLGDGRLFRDPSDDREDRDLALNGSLKWDATEHHKFTLSGQMRTIRDDNPGAPEQDRDTFSSSSSIKYSGKFSSGFSLDLALSANFSHRVNLDAKRSSDNSRNRDLLVDVKTRYERMGATFSHSFSLSAKRRIFDFDRRVNRLESQRKSNIRRGWSMRHSIKRKVLESVQLSTNYTLRADDVGTLIVENGAQVVEQENTDQTIGFGINYRPSPIFSIGVNYSYRLDREYDLRYTNAGIQRDLSRRNPHRNLAINTMYKPNEVTNLTFRFSRSQQRSGTFDSMNINLSKTIN